MTANGTVDRRLALADIADLRAYERERDEFRRHVIALKKKRRIQVGPLTTFLFENRDTVRFQIQEMARVEKLFTDEAIETELRVYNPLIPAPGTLSATLFVELTSDDLLREWLPKLVGIEGSSVLLIGSGDDIEAVPCLVDPEHDEMLTRDEMTASVHYVRFQFTAGQIERFAEQPVCLAIDHTEYRHQTSLDNATKSELLADLK